MNGQNLIIEGYRCRDLEEYNACKRDLQQIEKLKKQFNLNSFSDVDRLHGLLVSGSIRFESQFGRDFDDSIYELHENMQNKEVNSSDKSKKSNSNSSKSKDRKRIDLNDYDEDMQKQILQELKKREARRKLIMSLIVLTGVGCIAFFVVNFWMNHRNDEIKDQLNTSVNENKYKPWSERKEVKSEPVIEEEISEEPAVMLDKYNEVYQLNSDIVGWIKINDTVIDYPVMQGEDNEYYLTHNFNGNYDRNGCIFLDTSCSIYPRSSNLILYGHHMKSGKMFAALEKYASEKFYEKHRYIAFDTLYDEGVYEVMYVFRDRVYSQADVNFKYYEFYDASSEEEFNSYMKDMEDRSYYDTGVKASYGDALLTLSTCDYQQTNGRFVVVAKRIYE